MAGRSPKEYLAVKIVRDLLSGVAGRFLRINDTWLRKDGSVRVDLRKKITKKYGDGGIQLPSVIVRFIERSSEKEDK